MKNGQQTIAISEVAQTSVCVPVYHIALNPFAKIAACAPHAAKRKEN
jgi:hypothetical protein